MKQWQRYLAELLGTFTLVFLGCTAIVAAGTGEVQIPALIGIPFAFGFALLVALYAFGEVSGGHFNPAVSIGLAVAGRTEWRHIPGYIVAQLVGGVAGAGVVALIAADGPAGYFAAARDSGFASNGFGAASPGGFGLGAVLLAETLLMAVFVGVILSVTAKSEYKAVAPLAIGLTLTLVHLISIPISNTSVNPARSIAAAVFAGPDALGQVWVFLLAPVLGAAIAGLASKTLHRSR